VASEIFDSEARLSWVLAGLTGVLGATAFTHSAGYFVTFMTGNAQRAVLGYLRHDVVQSVTTLTTGYTYFHQDRRPVLD
jgi:uncharacterized membrane protein YoaK (UPF0700 family)